MNMMKMMVSSMVIIWRWDDDDDDDYGYDENCNDIDTDNNCKEEEEDIDYNDYDNDDADNIIKSVVIGDNGGGDSDDDDDDDHVNDCNIKENWRKNPWIVCLQKRQKQQQQIIELTPMLHFLSASAMDV